MEWARQGDETSPKGVDRMRWLMYLALVALLTSLARADDDKARAFTFGKDDVDKVPAGWTEDAIKGGRSYWAVVADARSPSKTGFILRHTAPLGGARPLMGFCIVDDTSYKD